MITTLSKQGGRRYPQMGSTGLAFAGWLLSGGVVVDTLIGRKYPRRRGRYRPRYEELVTRIVDSDQDLVAKEYSQQIIEQARQIASAKTDLEIAKHMMAKGRDKVEKLKALEARVEEAETRMGMLRDEEDLLMVILLTL